MILAKSGRLRLDLALIVFQIRLFSIGRCCALSWLPNPLDGRLALVLSSAMFPSYYFRDERAAKRAFQRLRLHRAAFWRARDWPNLKRATEPTVRKRAERKRQEAMLAELRPFQQTSLTVQPVAHRWRDRF
jgi:hypothetical protein